MAHLNMQNATISQAVLVFLKDGLGLWYTTRECIAYSLTENEDMLINLQGVYWK